MVYPLERVHKALYGASASRGGLNLSDLVTIATDIELSLPHRITRPALQNILLEKYPLIEQKYASPKEEVNPEVSQTEGYTMRETFDPDGTSYQIWYLGNM